MIAWSLSLFNRPCGAAGPAAPARNPPGGVREAAERQVRYYPGRDITSKEERSGGEEIILCNR